MRFLGNRLSTNIECNLKMSCNRAWYPFSLNVGYTPLPDYRLQTFAGSIPSCSKKYHDLVALFSTFKIALLRPFGLSHGFRCTRAATWPICLGQQRRATYSMVEDIKALCEMRSEMAQRIRRIWCTSYPNFFHISIKQYMKLWNG